MISFIQIPTIHSTKLDQSRLDDAATFRMHLGIATTRLRMALLCILLIGSCVHTTLLPNAAEASILERSEIPGVKRSDLFCHEGVHTSTELIELVAPEPSFIIPNEEPSYSLINSIEFHPQKNLCAATYLQNNMVVLYETTLSDTVQCVQKLDNPLAQLNGPQHAVFSPDGQQLVVINWFSNTLNVYEQQHNGLFTPYPVAKVTLSLTRDNHHSRQHGIAFSPCGHFFVVAYGSGKQYPRSIALFRVLEGGKDYKLIQQLTKKSSILGIPKGITFSPDGRCLLVTFAYPSHIALFERGNLS